MQAPGQVHGEVFIVGGDGHCRGQTLGHLAGEGGAGNDGHGALAQLLGHHLVQQLVAAWFQALGGPTDAGGVVQVWGDGLQGGTKGVGRDDDEQVLNGVDTGEVIMQLQRRGQCDAG